MKHQLKKLMISTCLCIPTLAFAQAEFTELDGSLLYFKYFPSPESKFKGTIIFQNGSGTSLKEWTENKTFLKCVTEQGNALMYDRSGIGQSPPDLSISAEKPTTAQRVNSKLMKLLKRNHVQAPYILVSHSYGGLYAGHFARQHPDLVAGMLMIDTVPSNFQYSNQILEKFENNRIKFENISSEEAYRLYNSANQTESNSMTADSFYQQLGFNTTKQQLAKSPRMSNKFPIIIASSTEMNNHAPIKGDWYTSQMQWLNKNPQSKIFQAQGGHFLQLDRPKLMCQQLKKLIEIAIKSSEPSQ